MIVRTLLASALLLSSLAAHAACSALLDRSFRPLADQTPVNLCERFEGQVLLVVNTASKCGFTPQYEGLEALHAEYAGKGFSVVGFPSNDFMGQEPGTEKEIREFCTLTYGVKFPMFEKVSVTGDAANPFYQELAKQGGGAPAWNFHKYLIGKDGQVIQAFGSRVKPDAPELRQAIDAALR
ncbi:MAG: glutathione peroxidase [Rhodanobacteraceae bacterium]|nr:glutathione peroxidase [Rhodanobacteraceae bacterium]